VANRDRTGDLLRYTTRRDKAQEGVHVAPVPRIVEAPDKLDQPTT
jgi:hypothetical protein